MRATAIERARELLVERNETVIAEPVIVNGREMVRYSVIAPEEVLPSGVVRGSLHALTLAGAWSDLDWDETVEALERIRHESVPTPPIELDGDSNAEPRTGPGPRSRHLGGVAATCSRIRRSIERRFAASNVASYHEYAAVLTVDYNPTSSAKT